MQISTISKRPLRAVKNLNLDFKLFEHAVGVVYDKVFLPGVRIGDAIASQQLAASNQHFESGLGRGNVYGKAEGLTFLMFPLDFIVELRGELYPEDVTKFGSLRIFCRKPRMLS